MIVVKTISKTGLEVKVNRSFYLNDIVLIGFCFNSQKDLFENQFVSSVWIFFLLFLCGIPCDNCVCSLESCA